MSRGVCTLFGSSHDPALAMPAAPHAEAPLVCHKCGQPAKLQCPKCLELGLEKDLAAFCSQQCFAVRGVHGAGGRRWLSLLPRCPCPSTHRCQAVSIEFMCLSVAPYFQASWAEHKKLHRPGPDGWHYATRRGMGRSLTMPEFKYTGDLRPERIGPTRPVCRRHFGGVFA